MHCCTLCPSFQLFQVAVNSGGQEQAVDATGVPQNEESPTEKVFATIKVEAGTICVIETTLL